MILIYGLRERLDPIKAELSDVIHSCLRSVLGLPEDKRAHRFVPMARDDFYYPGGRSDAYTVIEIHLIRGRAKDTKKALIKALFSEIESRLKISPIDVEITLHEQPAHCWGFRGISGDEAILDYEIEV